MADRVNVKNLKVRIKVRLNPRHLAVTAALIGGFLVMASVFAPDRLQAGGEGAVGPAGIELPSEYYSSEFRHNLTLLGEIESGQYTVKFYATAEGPLYSVYDSSGVELAELLTPRQIADRFPTLPLTDAHAEVPLRIMGTDVGPNW